MKRNTNWKFTLILCIVGFILAVQYNSMNTVSERDTRDLWAIRKELAKEKQAHSDLLEEIKESDQTLASYAQLGNEYTADALQTTLDKLYMQAGFVPVTGPGIVIKIEPSAESIAFGKELKPLSSELLTWFINAINQYPGNELEIDGKRFTTLSWIRDVNGKLTISGEKIATPPIEMKIVSPTEEMSNKLYNYLLSAEIQDEFYVDDFVLDISPPADSVTITGWMGSYENQFLQEQARED